MNTGIFGEGFPYSNFHELNMDWIIKIAKDFLDQYTHIQEIIEQGKTDIENLTTSGLEQLQDKADALTDLLDQWYNTHSEDIANQLADALEDLNEWYTTHQNYLDQTLANNIAEFERQAQIKAQQTLESIPDDYTTLGNNVTNILNNLYEEFDATKAYKNGDYVIASNGVLYRFVMDKPAGAWDSGYAKLAVLCDEENSDFNKNNELANSQVYENGTFYSYIPYTILEGVSDKDGNINTGIVGGNHLRCWVFPNHKYRISGRRWTAKSYPAVVYLNNNTVIGYENINVALDARFTNIDIITPSGCNNIYVNGLTFGYADGSPFIKDIQPAIKLNDKVFTEQPYTIETGVYDLYYTLNTAVGVHAKIPVTAGDIIKFSGYKFTNTYPILLIKRNNEFIGYNLGDTAPTTRYQNYYTVIQNNVDEIIIQCDSAVRLDIQKATPVNEINSWRGKNILWLGTSISATYAVFRDKSVTIPAYVGDLLGATVVNNSKGESMLRRGYDFYESDTDPYGWTGGYWNNIAYSLMSTLAEKEDLILNWETKWRDVLIGTEKPNELSNAEKELFRSCSFENRVVPYLNGTQTAPDLIVIEHGRNDRAWFDPAHQTINGQFTTNPDNMADIDRSEFGNALMYLIRLIRQYKPNMPILLVGHFDNSPVYQNVIEQQKLGAFVNGIFFCDTSTTGWNDIKVNVTGHWVDGEWEEDNIARVYTRRHQCLADDIHPASTKSGEPIMIESGIIAEYIAHNIAPQI